MVAETTFRSILIRIRIISVVAVCLFLCPVVTNAFMINGTEKAVETHSVSLGGNEYIPLLFVCDAYGVSYEWESLTNKIKLYKRGSLFTLVLNEPLVDLNGDVVKIGAPPKVYAGTVMVPSSILNLSWWIRGEKGYAGTPVVIPETFVVDTIILDPGHGGKDPGGLGKEGLKEKDLVLDISLRIKKELEAHGIKVLMTRDRDYFVSLADRAKMANESDADLFVSLHANAHWSTRAEGFEVYYLSHSIDDSNRAVEMLENAALEFEENADFPNKNRDDPTLWDLILTENRKESRELARAINCSVETDNAVCDRGVKSARFFVLKWVDKPSVLVELGFVTSHVESVKLKQNAYKDRLVKAIVNGVMYYKEEYETTRGFTI